MPDPVVTVLMPLFNGERYIREAVQSILRQTWQNFELLVIDDGSSDAGPDIIAAMQDERIVLLRNAENKGVAATLNHGLEIARGRYIARMDADDISLPDRLEHQVRFMDKHQQIGISGGWVRFFGVGPGTTLQPPCDPEALRCYALFENPFCHMAVIMRREMMRRHRLHYDGTFSRSEDYELWSRTLNCFPLANIERVLVKARQHETSATLSNWQEMTEQTERIQARMLQALRVFPSTEQQMLHHQIGRGYRQHALVRLHEGEQWLLHLCRCNEDAGYANAATFRGTVGQIWLRYCTNSAPLGPSVMGCWWRSPLRRQYAATVAELSRFVASILWHRIRPRHMPEHLSAGEAQRRKR